MVTRKRALILILVWSLAMPTGFIPLGATVDAQQIQLPPLPPSPVRLVIPNNLPQLRVGQEQSISFCNPAPANVNDLCGADARNPVGGQGPYHFQLDTMGGFPPMGMVLHPNGLLTGIPKAAGTTTFKVCAVDMTGYQNCQEVKIEVTKAQNAPQDQRRKKGGQPNDPQDPQQQAKPGSPSFNMPLFLGIVGGGGVAAAVVARKYLQNMGGGSSCDPSSAPVNEIYTYCFGSTRNTTQCNYYIAQYDKFCKSCGYSGFDAGTGACR